MKQILAQIKIRTSLIVLIVICVLCAAGWGQSSMSHLGNAASIDGLLPLSTDCLLVVGSIDPGGDSFVVTACGKSYSIRNVGQLGNFSRIMPTGNNTGWVILDGRLRKANFSRNGVSLDEAVAVGRSFWRDVFFLNARQGWACGSDGKIIGSRDGGRTWRSLVSTTDIDLMQVRFADKRLGWAIGREYRNGSFLSVFLTTSDGGEHWQKIDKDLVTASFVRGLRGCQGSVARAARALTTSSQVRPGRRAGTRRAHP